jgi:hypothetical protein
VTDEPEGPALVERTTEGTPGDPSWWWWCPGCKMPHRVTARWSVTGPLSKPTFAPSVVHRWTPPEGEQVCHCFVREGRIEFLADCTHALAGQTVPMTPWAGWGGP